MDQVLGIRPFVPARDFAQSQRFYEALGFRRTHGDTDVAGMKLGSFSFILQNLRDRELAETPMVQLLVRDVGAWWQRVEQADLVAGFGVKPPRPPSMQPWGMVVGFLSDPSGVLWHVAEVPF